MAQKKGLGRGLNDLLGTSDASRSPRLKKRIMIPPLLQKKK